MTNLYFVCKANHEKEFGVLGLPSSRFAADNHALVLTEEGMLSFTLFFFYDTPIIISIVFLLVAMMKTS